ncbi:agamous-like MADS-box protein AGL62 [Pistacia vera]|uniref:agamous-like MADS-box protein AGL62 n=1 Tax=Pistacia vera TaxID=55513 RepID=UPI0012631D50|nr:agamous-like MADS-box protein AGL62 [Pistacia vera]
MAPASRKIPMKKRETRAKRAVTFSKRRYGLFNKAAELCILSGAKIAMAVSSPCSKQNIFSFGHPSVYSVFDAFRHNRVPPPVDDAIKRSAVSLYNEIKELEKERKNGEEKIDGLLNDFEDMEKNLKSIDELLVVEEKMENLKDNALMRLSELLSSNDFASGIFGDIHVHNTDFSNGINAALASEFSHLDQILMNGDNNSVFNPDFPGKIGNNSFFNANFDVGINNASSSNAVYPSENFLGGETINQGVEFGAMVTSISNPEAYFDQNDSENLQAMFDEYENKNLHFFSSADTDQISIADFVDQNEAMPLATVDQFGQLLSYGLPYFFH